ncbi:Beta-glucosidase [Pleurostoma richardsiae]|uniref:beta-glucosidase n=1 Tax=Pleurostoma richardsiae TaxID=41990 RepID=A0AA38SAF8_9PEZI|nr:Beta-glucosidase [Pleurostoma richardsiae]
MHDEISDILSRLTLEEKISFLAGTDWWRTPVIKRDGVFVPHLKLTDGPNGARGESYVSGIKAACFPCGTCLGATFDTGVLYETGRCIAREAKSKAANILLGPTLNVIRSPLGGRNYETYSEDPLVLGSLAAAYVRGCQDEGVAATPKHFVANEAENSRTKLSVEVDEQTLREIYLKAFQFVVKLSDPWCFMTSYNKVNNEYVADSSRLVNDVLREEWGFKGLIISDWMGTYSTGPGIEAGVDIEMPAPAKWRTKDLVLRLIENGTLSTTLVDKTVGRVLELAKRLGRFENPEEPPEREVEDAKRDGFIKTAAAEGMVLLKNDASVLPIPRGASVAMIGQHAASLVQGGGGSARVNALHAVTPIHGMQSLGYNVRVASGVPVFGAVPHAEPSIILQTGKEKPTLKPVKIEWFNGNVIGENQVHEDMVALPEYMIKEKWPDYLAEDYCTRITFDIVAPSSGDHIFSVISTGRADCLIDGKVVFERPQETNLKPESFYFFKRYLERRFTYKMDAGRRYTIQLHSWACEPDILHAPPVSGMMFQGSTVRFHENIDLEERKREASIAAKECDYAVVCVGTTNEFESEGYDRDTMDLTPDQYDLIDSVVKSNPKTVVINFSGSPVGMTQFSDKVPAILQAWFPGQEGGDSVAAVLSGLINPSGRLPLSWPRKIEDNSSFGNFPVGDDLILKYEEGLDVGYRWYDRPTNPDPLYPFGFGLSYTTFAISSAMFLNHNVISNVSDTLQVHCEIENLGSRSGKTVLQCYIQLPTRLLGRTRPVKELQAFSKVAIDAGKKEKVILNLDKYSFSFYDADDACWRAQEGSYKLLIGLSSVDISHTMEFSLSSGFTWTGK